MKACPIFVIINKKISTEKKSQTKHPLKLYTLAWCNKNSNNGLTGNEGQNCHYLPIRTMHKQGVDLNIFFLSF